MPSALSVSLPLIMAFVLMVSGIAKLRHPDDLAGWEDLGVPRVLRQQWLVRLHPWAEIALGVALAVLGGVVGLLAAVAAVVLLTAYTILIVRAVSRRSDTSCACFGEPAPVTGWTVVRNVWLTALAVAAALVIWVNPLLGGAVVAARGSLLWVVAIAAGMATMFFIAHRPAPEVQTTAPEGGGLDYTRTRTPAVPVQLADGTMLSLRTLTQRRPLLLLAVSETCSSCRPVIESIERYREKLPEVDVRFILAAAPDESALTSVSEPQTVHDPERSLANSLADALPTPAAILFGMDGMLAGGPEVGARAIDSFVDDIDENLHGASSAR